MNRLAFLLACLLVLGGSPVLAEDPSVVVVRVNERSGMARLVIERGTGPQETLEFESGNNKTESASAAKNYHQVISKLYQQGYVLQSTIPGSTEPGFTWCTLVFVKAARP
ncbi:hypothetical protein [Hymenobacter latericus]|uniref:hypothetical protein n=1 Tax=Hymenobacter sp. YIM 151858-1 TaxID=2987688 RepID=UPI0022272F79|nr:hypothetical protein [Hymenobacter sp. YIM 151858-1]UYZ61225.1 hypothetical protein OIS50_19845 [Hymenobacter sp. YIM 151858-1]